MKIISERHKVTKTWHELCFEDQPYCGFGFPCDENGNVEPLNPAAQQNYEDCMAGKYPHLHKFIRERNDTHTQPAIGICDKCKSEVQLVDEYCGATECECGEWYNLSGQSILPPEQWQEPIDSEDYY